MTDLSIDLVKYLRKLTLEEDADLLRESLKLVVQLLMEADVSAQIQAQKYERTPERVTQRNGYRERRLESRLGELELRIPKVRQGSYYPDWLLDPRRPAERALVNVIQQAYIQGVSTRKMEQVVQALGFKLLFIYCGLPELADSLGEISYLIDNLSCQEPDVNVPPMFTENVPPMFTENVPPMFTNNVPPMFTQNVPPCSEPAPGRGTQDRFRA